MTRDLRRSAYCTTGRRSRQRRFAATRRPGPIGSWPAGRAGVPSPPMRIVRFLSGGQTHLGQAVDGRSAKVIEGNLLGEHRVTDRVLPVEKLLAPMVPIDILCIGINYREHAAESGSAV